MNKVLCLCAAATLAFASCSNDETVEIAKQNAISFRSVVGLNTKGAETTTGNLSAINVTAYKGTAEYFKSIKYEKNTTYFESTQKYYWPADDSELTFTAFSENWSGTPTFTSSSDIKVAGVTVADEVADQKDMVYVTGVTGHKNANETTGLPLALGHALSQIQINAKNGNDLYKYKVKGIRIAKVKNGGDFNVIDASWTQNTTEKTYEVTYDAPVALQADGQSIMGTVAGNAMLIPQTTTIWDASSIDGAVNGSYISVLLQITTNTDQPVYPNKAGGYAWAAVPVEFNWEMGKKYIYTLDFTNGAGKVDPVNPGPDWNKDDPQKDPDKGKDILGEPIKFTVTVTNWADAPSDVNM